MFLIEESFFKCVQKKKKKQPSEHIGYLLDSVSEIYRLYIEGIYTWVSEARDLFEKLSLLLSHLPCGGGAGLAFGCVLVV